MSTLLDFEQAVQLVTDDTAKAFQTKVVGPDGTPTGTPTNPTFIENVGGSFVPEKFDEIDLTYIPSGNGAGQIGTVVYKLSTATIATLTLTYDGSNNLISVVKS